MAADRLVAVAGGQAGDLEQELLTLEVELGDAHEQALAQLGEVERGPGGAQPDEKDTTLYEYDDAEPHTP